MKIIMLIDTEADQQNYVRHRLSRQGRSEDVKMLAGHYDIILRMDVESSSDLKNKLSEIREINGVRSTDCHIVLE